MRIRIELEPSKWSSLSIRERANIIRNSVKNHFANGGSMTDISIDDIRHLYNEGREEDIYTKANALLDKRMRQLMMENRPSYEDWINRERNKVTLAAFEYSNLRTSPSYVMLDNPYKTEEEWASAMNSIIAERQKELNDSIRLNANQPPMIQKMNVSMAQLKLDDAIWEKNLGYSSKIPANSCLTTATDNYVQVTGDKSYGANLNSYFQNSHPGYEVVPGFEEAAYGDIVLLLEDNGEAKHGMIYAGLNDLGQYIFNNSNGGPDDVAYLKGISFHSINTDKNPNDHVLILRFIGNDKWNEEKEKDYNFRYPAFMLGGNLFDDGGPEDILEGNSPSDLMRNDNIGFLQGYYPKVHIPKQSLYEAADNSGLTLVPYLGDGVDALQAANLAKLGKYAEAAMLGATLLIPNILEKPLKFLGTKALKYFSEGIETAEDFMKLSDDNWYSAYRKALHMNDKEGALNIQLLRVLLKKESGQEVAPFKTNLENLYVLTPSYDRDYKTYTDLFHNWNLDRDYFYKKYRTVGDLRKRYDSLKVKDGKIGQKLLESINLNETALKLEIEQAVKEGKVPETFLEDLEFYTKDTYGRIPEYDAEKHLVLAPWQNELKLTITTDPQTGQLIYDLLPIHQDSKYRYVGKDAYEDYVSRGVVSNVDDTGERITRHGVPMFTSRNPSSYGFDQDKIWLVSKPEAPLEWESAIGHALTPTYKGVLNKAPLNMFDIFLESSEGFRKLLGSGGTLFGEGGAEEEPSGWKEGFKDLGSLVWDGVKLADPSGITSWGDAYTAIKDAYNNPSIGSISNAGIETLGALPMIGKLGKVAKLGRAVVQGSKVLNDADNVVTGGEIGKTFANLTMSGSMGAAGLLGAFGIFNPTKDYTGMISPTRDGLYDFTAAGNQNPVFLGLYGKGNFTPYEGEEVIVNGKPLLNVYNALLLPMDTIKIPKSKLEYMKQLIGNILQVNGDNIHSMPAKYNTPILDSHNFGIGVKDGYLRAYDTYDFGNNPIDKIGQAAMHPTWKYPKAGVASYVLEIPIQYVADDKENDWEFLESLMNETLRALGGPLYNAANPIESFNGFSRLPLIRY